MSPMMDNLSKVAQDTVEYYKDMSATYCTCTRDTTFEKRVECHGPHKIGKVRVSGFLLSSLAQYSERFLAELYEAGHISYTSYHLAILERMHMRAQYTPEENALLHMMQMLGW